VKTNRIWVPTTLCVLLLFCLVEAKGPALVSASLCQITNVSYDYPQQAQPNQQIVLTSTINASCSYTDAGVYYLAMVVVNDASSGQQIASNSAAIGYVSLEQPNVTATISNLITCPSGNVAWQLKLTVYVINDFNEYFAPFQDTALIHYLTINVGTVQQQQTVVTTTTTTTSPTITSFSSTSQMTTNTTTTSAPATSLETNNQSSITSQSLTILGLTILIVLLILFWKKRTTSKQNNALSKTDTKKQKNEKRNSHNEGS